MTFRFLSFITLNHGSQSVVAVLIFLVCFISTTYFLYFPSFWLLLW